MPLAGGYPVIPLSRSGALAGFGLSLALLVWLPFGLAGVPLDTPDGFLHLGWAAGWARQMAGGWWWSQWSHLNWAGAGSFALAIDPPLFRWFLGLPLLLGIPPDHALRLMQWAHPLWRVQMRPAPSTEQPSPPWSTPLPAGGLDQGGWISIPLPPGRWEVALTYGRAC